MLMRRAATGFGHNSARNAFGLLESALDPHLAGMRVEAFCVHP